MFKRVLPENCPPKDAIELDVLLYRIFHNNVLTENEFKPYIDLEPENETYKKLCIAYAVSFYSTIEGAYNAYKKAFKKEKILGHYIAKLKLPSNIGKMENRMKDHYSIWFYDQENIENIICEEIISIDDYERN